MALPDSCSGRRFTHVGGTTRGVGGSASILVIVNVNNSCLNTHTTVRFLGNPCCGGLEDKIPRVCFTNGGVDNSCLSSVLGLYRNGHMSMGVVSGSNAAARPTVTFHIFEGLLRRHCNRRRTTGHVCYAASGSHNALGGLTSRGNCRYFIMPSSINKHFSILATINLLPVTTTNNSVSTLVTNTTGTVMGCGGRGLCRGSYCLCTTLHGTFCHGNGSIRLLIDCRPHFAVVTR